MTTAPQSHDNDRYTRGLAVLQKIAGTPRPAVLDSLADIAPDLARFTVEFGYGDIISRPGLTLRERQLATVSALAALGNAAPQLRFHIDGALNVGCTRREIVETFIHASVYAGFPAALNALTAAREVFTVRPDTAPDAAADTASDTARDAQPDDGTAVDPAAAVDPDCYRRGLAALTRIDGHAGEQVVASLQDIAPDLAVYLIEFAFGDVYSRTGLDLKTRELTTIAMCTALGTAGPQLRFHIHGFLNVGGTRQEVVEILTQMAAYAGFPAALNGIAAAREVFAERAATA
ncbi:carboxymuconolactone decarboxylase family protein [Streptomyces sp. H10-C2]|uniref:carboxymuconolactone decarboxylase family protein n=1 Tax=unclassified Streptomyces TaxID=2593676 RepID=UPI0024B87AA8|nr:MULTISPECIES: carboxymuconolactone decarboxylase family protein [unclassified Streptomyces]MDJ0340524.1 carboxymuconolactone decarboxylase family protein [Streptomyces sp. PH10-H1]MDJ0370172.1 carboxymuconolactone decarboxylase family protein [Streptomyces sp. H10-C2]